MKPYRGTLLAAAVLIAALPLSGCGDAENYAKTDSISLSTSTATVIVKREVIFTVKTTAPINQYECETVLEYRAEGGGFDRLWTPVPGTGTTRVFGLKPHEVGTLSVLARGKCVGAKEDWKYTNQVDVQVTEVDSPITSLTLVANPASVEINKPVTFSLSATRVSPCTLALRLQYSGAGYGLMTVDPAVTGQFILTPTIKGTLTVTATGWCTQNPKAEVTVTTAVAVTDEILPAVTAVTLTADRTTVAGGNIVVYTLSATKNTGCTLNLRYVASGPGYSGATVTASPGTFILTPTAVIADTTLTVKATGWCTENPSAIVSSDTVSVTVTP